MILLLQKIDAQRPKVANSINIALKKIQGRPVTASTIKSNVNKLKSMVCQDEAYLFSRQIHGTPLLGNLYTADTSKQRTLDVRPKLYCRFQLTFHRNFPKFVVKFASSKRSSKVHFRICIQFVNKLTVIGPEFNDANQILNTQTSVRIPKSQQI